MPYLEVLSWNLKIRTVLTIVKLKTYCTIIKHCTKNEVFH